MAPPKKDISGQRFGKLIAIKPAGYRTSDGTMWICKCDCGNTKTASLNSLGKGDTRSCGCLRKPPPIIKTHGQSHTKLYHVWHAMKMRCLNKNDPVYYRYGGRGITVCKEWIRFEPFAKWAKANGYIEGELDLDRINNDEGYSPDNCRWVSHQENLLNTHRKTAQIIDGEECTLRELAFISGIKYHTIETRYQRGVRGKDLIKDVAIRRPKSGCNKEKQPTDYYGQRQTNDTPEQGI